MKSLFYISELICYMLPDIKDTSLLWMTPVRRTGFLIYYLIIGIFFSGFISLFFIDVFVSVTAPGIIRPFHERTEIRSAVSEIIDSLYFREGDPVETNNLLMSIRDPAVIEKKQFRESEINTRKDFIHDLKLLTGMVQAGEVICSVSPGGRLLGECYVGTKDIGMLRPGQAVRFQIGAFDYNYFGTVTGSIYKIDNDFILIDKNPVFKVMCWMDHQHMTCSKGFSGEIKKGMRLQARFITGKRTLWQLLYDTIDNWINPMRSVS